MCGVSFTPRFTTLQQRRSQAACARPPRASSTRSPSAGGLLPIRGVAPDLFAYVVAFSLCNFCGTYFLLRVVAKFSSNSAVMVTSVRKVFTLGPSARCRGAARRWRRGAYKPIYPLGKQTQVTPKALLRPHPIRRLTVVDFPVFLYVTLFFFGGLFFVFVSLLEFAYRESHSRSIIVITPPF